GWLSVIAAPLGMTHNAELWMPRSLQFSNRMRSDVSARTSMWADVTYALMRVVVGTLFLMHGLQKVFGLWGIPQASLTSQFGIAGVIETLTGVLIIIGLFTTPAAFIASGEMAFAYFIAHAPRGTFPIQNGGELAVAYCFVFLYVMTQGDGRYSVGALM